MDIEKEIAKYEKMLSMGQELGAGGFKYDYEGEEREEIQRKLRALYKQLEG